MVHNESSGEKTILYIQFTLSLAPQEKKKRTGTSVFVGKSTALDKFVDIIIQITTTCQ